MAKDDEAPVDHVELAPFFLGRTEITQGQWERLSGGERPSWFKPGYVYPGRPVPIDGSHPVEQVSWFECSELLSRYGLRMATEAQWEYACRAGSTTPWFTGRTWTTLVGHVNAHFERQQADAYTGTLPVASFPANAFGLHDMSGNVSEWCRDFKWRYIVPHRPGDGLRAWDSEERFRVIRGAANLAQQRVRHPRGAPAALTDRRHAEYLPAGAAAPPSPAAVASATLRPFP